MLLNKNNQIAETAVRNFFIHAGVDVSEGWGNGYVTLLASFFCLS